VEPTSIVGGVPVISICSVKASGSSSTLTRMVRLRRSWMSERANGL